MDWGGLKIRIIYDIEEDLEISTCPFCKAERFRLVSEKTMPEENSIKKGTEVVRISVYKCDDCGKFFGSGFTADGREFLWLQQTEVPEPGE